MALPEDLIAATIEMRSVYIDGYHMHVRVVPDDVHPAVGWCNNCFIVPASVPVRWYVPVLAFVYAREEARDMGDSYFGKRALDFEKRHVEKHVPFDERDDYTRFRERSFEEALRRAEDAKADATESAQLRMVRDLIRYEDEYF